MYYCEAKDNILRRGGGYAIAYCVSADFDFLENIAENINNRFGVRERLVAKFGNNWYADFDKKGATCIASGPFSVENGDIKNIMLFNLVTKKNCGDENSIDCIKKSFFLLRRQCKRYNVSRVAISKEDSGFDGIKWEKIYVLLYEAFHNTNITVIAA